jgi:hypothetical protein
MELQSAIERTRHAHGSAVVHETDHVDPLDQPVAGCDHQAAQQRRPDAAVLERPLHRNGALRRSGPAGPDQLELTDPPHLAARDVSDHPDPAPVEPLAIGGDLRGAHVATKAAYAIRAVQPQQMVPDLVALAGP